MTFSAQTPLFEAPISSPNLPTHLLDIQTIYHEPNVEKYRRGREILARFPQAERIVVPSHWNIAGLHGNEGQSESWIRNKRQVLVLGVRKSLQFRPNGRSADFIVPGHANGCALSCAYCVEEGTLISTLQGPKPVEQIQDGDEVWCVRSSSGQLAKGVVCGTAAREVHELLEIQVGGTTLHATGEHPLLTRKGWVKAVNLSSSDEVLCDSDRTVPRRFRHRVLVAGTTLRAKHGVPANCASCRSFGSKRRAQSRFSPNACPLFGDERSASRRHLRSSDFPHRDRAQKSSCLAPFVPDQRVNRRGNNPDDILRYETVLHTCDTSTTSRAAKAAICQRETRRLHNAQSCARHVSGKLRLRHTTRKFGTACSSSRCAARSRRRSKRHSAPLACHTNRSSSSLAQRYFSAPRLRWQRVTSILHVQRTTCVYNFHVPGFESYIANGIVTHNCYVPRRKGFANPISTFVNIEQVMRAIERHVTQQGRKTEPNMVDPKDWVYEMGQPRFIAV